MMWVWEYEIQKYQYSLLKYSLSLYFFVKRYNLSVCIFSTISTLSSLILPQFLPLKKAGGCKAYKIFFSRLPFSKEALQKERRIKAYNTFWWKHSFYLSSDFTKNIFPLTILGGQKNIIILLFVNTFQVVVNIQRKQSKKNEPLKAHMWDLKGFFAVCPGINEDTTL